MLSEVNFVESYERGIRLTLNFTRTGHFYTTLFTQIVLDNFLRSRVSPLQNNGSFQLYPSLCG
jgi:hypothetical protein